MTFCRRLSSLVVIPFSTYPPQTKLRQSVSDTVAILSYALIKYYTIQQKSYILLVPCTAHQFGADWCHGYCNTAPQKLCRPCTVHGCEGEDFREWHTAWRRRSLGRSVSTLGRGGCGEGGRQGERVFKIILLRSVYFKITTIPCLSLILILNNCMFMQNTFLLHRKRSSLLGKAYS